jgi:flagellar basal body-associated protein FliL
MVLRRRAKRKLMVILAVFLLAFIMVIAAAGAWGFGKAMFNWPVPLNYFLG